MRTFVIIMHKAKTSPEFSLNDLPGSGGRIDILCRFITSSLLISHGVRKQTKVYGILLGPPCPPVSLKVLGSEVKYLNPDERSTGALIRNGLIKLQKSEGKGWIRTSPGFYFARKGLREILEELKDTRIYLMKEEGKDIWEEDIRLPAAFFMSDHMDFYEKEEREIGKVCSGEISLGPVSLHSEHCTVIINNYLDRREASVRFRGDSVLHSLWGSVCERAWGVGASWWKDRRRGEP